MYVDTKQLAQASGVSRQAVEKALQRIVRGQTAMWRGHALEVRTVEGRGGKSGIQYQVKVSSLPALLQDRLKALQSDVEGVSNIRFGEQAQLSRNWKYDVIRPILELPKGSAGRRAAIAKLEGSTRLDWRGKRMLLSRSQLYRWISIYEQGEGIHGLAHKVRKDKGTQRVFVSLEFTRSVPLDNEAKATIHADLKQYVRSLIKGGAQRKQTRVLASEKLKAICAAYGYICNDPQREPLIFHIPHEFVQQEMHFKAVYRHKTDRKASEDNKPRIRRSTASLAPMEVVVADVHHINVLVARENGSTATPKLLAFHDIATNRVFCEVIFFEDRGGVRNADIITAFTNMCAHPAFGIPQFLYVDNGSEYGFADDLEDALKLGCKVFSFTGEEERKRVIRAKAYNAAAKHVEGWFRQMNQQYFRHIQGWIDDDRMNPKRPAMGKLPTPFNHGFDALRQTIHAHIQAYEHMPQNGALKGKSPATVFGEYVQAGWKATILDADRLLTVFTKPQTRVVRKHGISVGPGDRWTCDGLLEYFGRTVTVHIPKYHGFAELLVTDEAGNHIGIATRDKPFDVLDTRGAKESARRVSVRNKALTKLGKSVPDIDVGAEIISYGERQLPVIPNEPEATISVTRPGSQRRAILPVEADRHSRQQRDEELRSKNRADSEIFAQMQRLAGNKA